MSSSAPKRHHFARTRWQFRLVRQRSGGDHPEFLNARARIGFAAVCAIFVLTLYLGLVSADPILPVAHSLMGGEFRYTVKRGDTFASH